MEHLRLRVARLFEHGASQAVHVKPGSYNDQMLIGVLGQLRRFLQGQKVTLLWDGVPSHRSRLTQAFITSQRGWLVAARLPGYAPELNPVEGLWSNLKGHELADTTRDGVRRIRRRPRLLFAFLDRTGLSL
jgi:transposase